MNRRELLAGVSAIAVAAIIPLDADAWIRGNAYSNFQGNPNVAITAINTSGGIVCSRTSGKTPCFIHVSASAITATGTSVPYQDLSYSWNFGDASGTEIFTNPATGQSVNANNGQTGPESAYCYRSAGTYTVTLTIIGKNGNSYITATKTQSITVSDFAASTTWYYDSNATGANNGTSAANAFTSLSTLSSKIQSNNNVQIYLARGSDWLSAGNTSYIQGYNCNGVRISAYGTGANPIVGCSTDTGGNALIQFVTSSSGDAADVVVSNVDFKVTGSSFSASSIGLAQVNNTNHTLANIYFDNCSFTTNLSSAHSMNLVTVQFSSKTSSGNFDGFGIWGGAINSLPGDLAYGQAFFGGSRNWHFIIGLTNVNGLGTSDGTAAQGNHHLYQSVGNHVINRWINFGSSLVAGVATRNYAVKIDNYTPPSFSIATGGFAAAPGTGYIRLTLQAGSDTSQLVDGANIYIENVAGTGYNDVVSVVGGAVTVVNSVNNGQGVWPCSIVDSTHLDLVGTTFNAGHTYLTGNLGMAIAAINTSNYIVVDGNNVTGTQRSFDANNNWGNSYASAMSNYVIQNNAVHDQPYVGAASLPIALSLTYRDNRHWNNSTEQFIPSQGLPKNAASIFRMYRNKFYVPSSVPAGTQYTDAIVIFGATAILPWTNPQQFTDNIIYDARAVPALVTLDDYSHQQSISSIINRNHYYAPGSSSYMFSGSTKTNLATWKGAPYNFDADPNVNYPSDANYGNPGWTVPPTQWSDFGP